MDLEILSKEISSFGLNSTRLKIDRNALILQKNYINREKEAQFDLNFGSTCTGTGIGVAERVLRKKDVRLARDIPGLKPFLTDVSREIMSLYVNGKRIIVEGTQGFGLSLYHSSCYPYATSRDTTASGFLSEVGLGPLTVSDVVMVLRTFPIRVGGNSGPLPNEIDWKTVQSESGYPYEIKELTTVTKKLRRVAKFDLEVVKRACLANWPTSIALMGIDYLDFKNINLKKYDQLSGIAKGFVNWLKHELNVEISIIGTGPNDEDLIDRFKGEENEREGNTEQERSGKGTIDAKLSLR